MSALEPALRGREWPMHPPRLPDGDVAYCVHDTPVGPLVLAVDASGAVVSCSYDDEGAVAHRLAHAVSPRVLRQPWRLDEARAELDAYLLGTRRGFTVPVSLALATLYARRVLASLQSVEYGQITSYGQISEAIGAPRSARAVGNALGRNPVCIFIPCHRVLRGGGGLGGYAGGTAAKETLLELEHAVAGAPA